MNFGFGFVFIFVMIMIISGIYGLVADPENSTVSGLLLGFGILLGALSFPLLYQR